MQTFTTKTDLIDYLKTIAQKKTIGFVATMGALHQGHLSLIEESNTKCDITICSIFINPTQFNNPEDLANYPNTLDKDLLLLKKATIQSKIYLLPLKIRLRYMVKYLWLLDLLFLIRATPKKVVTYWLIDRHMPKP